MKQKKIGIAREQKLSGIVLARIFMQANQVLNGLDVRRLIWMK